MWEGCAPSRASRGGPSLVPSSFWWLPVPRACVHISSTSPLSSRCCLSGPVSPLLSPKDIRHRIWGPAGQSSVVSCQGPSLNDSRKDPFSRWGLGHTFRGLTRPYSFGVPIQPATMAAPPAMGRAPQGQGQDWDPLNPVPSPAQRHLGTGQAVERAPVCGPLALVALPLPPSLVPSPPAGWDVQQL